MILVAVLGFRKDFVEYIRRIICGKDNILITDTEAQTVDILIISRRKLNCYIRTKILIIADDLDECGCIKADMAISCGISDRNTITLSSSTVICVCPVTARAISSTSTMQRIPSGSFRISTTLPVRKCT